MSNPTLAVPPAIARRGVMLVLSSPSGAGKSTIARELLRADEALAMSVSVTTRPPRRGEEHGREYFFVDPVEFKRMADAGELLEHASVFGNHYGTPRAAVEKALTAGRDILFDVDWQGTQQLREQARDDLVSVFILPPSRQELEQRLWRRAQDPDEVVRARMAKASAEMSHWAEYDYIVINRVVDAAVAEVRAILTAERLRKERRVGLVEYVRAISDA